MIKTECIPVGQLSTNCYLLTDEQSGRTAVVDPGVYTPALRKALENKNPDFILLTHGHYDHIGGVNEIVRETRAQVVIGKKEEPFLSDNTLNLSVYLSGAPLDKIKADITLCGGESIMLGNTRLTFMETPGHTVGSGCYIFDDCIISGDTLFCKSIGRTDMATGSISCMYRSLERLKALEGDYRVFPGHGPITTLDCERAENPYMRSNGYEDIY